MNHTKSFARNILVAVLVIFSASSARIAAAQESVIYSFGAGGASDGVSPYESLIFDSKGNLFGTTLSGGLNGQGTVFELSPVAGGEWTEKVIYRFGSSTNADGFAPRGALVLDGKGNLYGSTLLGGTNNSGTVFELSVANDGSWKETVIYSFGSQDADGFLAVGNLVFDAQGNLYGVTVYGGANSGGGAGGLGYGTLYELSPSVGGSWTEQVLHSFGASGTDGAFPRGGLAIDPAGKVYGTTSLGGSHSDLSSYGGTVFQLTPGNKGTSTEKILHDFDPSSGDGSYPMASVLLDSKGTLYGTTAMGGDTNAGTVFELSPVTGGPWTENVFKFAPKSVSGVSASGYGPTAGLTIDSAGTLYGTTVNGGAGTSGTVFELTPSSGGTLMETVLQSFPTTASDGLSPHGGVVLDSKGNLYGTTALGGTQGAGTVYKIQLASPTMTSLALSAPAGLVEGKPITLTATVVAVGGSGNPTGTVTFAAPSGGSVTVHLDQTGTAVYKGVVPAVGMYSVFSRYNGAPGLAESVSATITRTVTAH